MHCYQILHFVHSYLLYFICQFSNSCNPTFIVKSVTRHDYLLLEEQTLECVSCKHNLHSHTIKQLHGLLNMKLKTCLSSVGSSHSFMLFSPLKNKRPAVSINVKTSLTFNTHCSCTSTLFERKANGVCKLGAFNSNLIFIAWFRPASFL